MRAIRLHDPYFNIARLNRCSDINNRYHRAVVLQSVPISNNFHGCTALLVLRFVVVKWRYIKYKALSLPLSVCRNSVLKPACLVSDLYITAWYCYWQLLSRGIVVAALDDLTLCQISQLSQHDATPGHRTAISDVTGQ